MFTNFCTVKNNGACTDQTFVPNFAGVDYGTMGNRYSFTYYRRIFAGTMDHYVVLETAI
jgi:hypothetical protein